MIFCIIPVLEAVWLNCDVPTENEAKLEDLFAFKKQTTEKQNNEKNHKSSERRTLYKYLHFTKFLEFDVERWDQYLKEKFQGKEDLEDLCFLKSVVSHSFSGMNAIQHKQKLLIHETNKI